MSTGIRRRVSPLWLIAMLAAGTAGCVSAPHQGPSAAPRSAPASTRRPGPTVDLPGQLRVRVDGVLRTVPLDDYVLGSALSEVSPVGESADTVARIFEVQAILARTYAVVNLGRHAREGFDLCDQTHCQLYQPARIGASRFTDSARAAVLATQGQVVLFDGRPARVLFHSDCGGHTAAAEDVWTGQPLAYLAGIPDEPATVVHRRWQFSASPAQLGQALRSATGATSADPVQHVRVIRRDASGRAVRVEAARRASVTLTGEEFRRAVNALLGPTAIRSTRFDVSTEGGHVTFTGTGFGHGVGLCQTGAAARARRGESAPGILATYFPGTEITGQTMGARVDPPQLLPFPGAAPRTASR